MCLIAAQVDAIISAMIEPGIELRFHDEMLEIYKRAKSDCHYNAARFLQMVSSIGGLQAAQSLLAAPGLSDGFTALWQCGRLD